MWITAIAVFVAVAVLDAFWTKYFLATKNKLAVKAGNYSALIMAFSGLVTRAYNHDGWLLVPAVMGAFVGTYIAVKYHKDENVTS